MDWQAFRLAGQDALAVRASKKLKSDELLVTSFAATRLRMELDRVPLWRGDHVAVKQLVEDFARYLYLPRLKDSSVLLGAMREGGALLTWESDAFAFADSFDESSGRYRGLRAAHAILLPDAAAPGLLVKPVVARRQLDAEIPKLPTIVPPPGPVDGGGDRPIPWRGDNGPIEPPKPIPALPTRFYGTVILDPARVGRDASRIAEEVIAHLSGVVGAKVRVTLEVEAEIPSGASDQIVRTVTENSRTLKFTSQGFEKE